MDTDRPPHRTSSSSSTSGELIICFTSRLSSSSSMKLSSKSILSPGRSRDSSQISLSTSLSRRLRNSGSLKGGGQASPMFPATNGKKRGCSFENPEPSSPKVTCIGQVRVKTKKKGKKTRAASRSRREVSFRRTEPGGSNSMNSSSTNSSSSHHHQFHQPPQECLPHRNQRWVHLPVTICEALRAFGTEFNCFLPCRSSCMASQREDNKEGQSIHHHHHQRNGNSKGSDGSCGAVFARWLVAEKIELVVGEDARRNENDVEDDDDMPRSSRRRHVFEDIVIEEGDNNNNKCDGKNEILAAEAEEEEEGRVSICVPPKNALLLMRCRSDPVKMAALANRFWECPPPQDEDENEVLEEEEEEEEREQVKMEHEQKVSSNQISGEDKIPDAEAVEEAEIEVEGKEIIEKEEEIRQQLREEARQIVQELLLEVEAAASASASASDSYTEALADPDNEQNGDKLLSENENVVEDKRAFDDIEEKRPSLSSSYQVFLQQEQEAEVKVAEDSTDLEEEVVEGEEEAEKVEEKSETGEMTQEMETSQESKEEEGQRENFLPDCLLLMMCEPKLSMEVSKETWVCSTDFIRWQPPGKKPPPQMVNKTDGCDEQIKKRVGSTCAAAKPGEQQRQLLMHPPRSSCSFPAAPPLPPALGAPSVKTMNTMIEQKLVGAAKPSCEPLVLKRCKSEPRKSAAKLAPETCFWKNRKIEPHRPATVGVGAAGVGF